MSNVNLVIKQKGFNPAPYAGNIPFFANSEINPDCRGGRLHTEFWEEIIYHLQNGFTTGGLWIPGPYFMYLNFKKVAGLYGPVFPNFIDTHHQLALEWHEVKISPDLAGMIIPKARRKGLSFFATMEGDYGARIIPQFRMAIAGGLDNYVQGFRKKLVDRFNDVPPELQMHILKDNEDEFQVGYEYRTDKGWRKNLQGHFMFETLKDQATKLEGEFFHIVVMEEMGEFPRSDQAYESIRPALEMGERIEGKFLMYGTGGNMLKGSKAFKHFSAYKDSYGLRKRLVLGNQFYYPYFGGAKNKDGTSAEKIPYVKAKHPDLAPEQYLGCEDLQAAEEAILNGRLIRSKNPDKRALTEWNKKYPLNEDEIFTSSGSNNFNTDKLYEKLIQTQSTPEQKWNTFKLEFVKDKDGDMMIPFQVKAIPVEENLDDGEIVYIFQPPKLNIKDLDVGGVDSYNEDVTTTTDSLGAMTVVRRADEIILPDTLPGRIPVCLYYRRPKRKEIFFQTCLKISIYYNLIKNTMISAEYDLIIQYYKDMGAKKYLSPRPKSFDSPDTEQHHDYGVKMNSYSKPRMVGLLQSWVEDFTHLCEFPDMLKDLIAYDDQNIGTDYDSADALGYALMRIIDMKRTPQEDTKNKKARSDLPEYIEVNGIIIQVNYPDEDEDEKKPQTVIELGRGKWQTLGD